MCPSFRMISHNKVFFLFVYLFVLFLDISSYIYQGILVYLVIYEAHLNLFYIRWTDPVDSQEYIKHVKLEIS